MYSHEELNEDEILISSAPFLFSTNLPTPKAPGLAFFRTNFFCFPHVTDIGDCANIGLLLVYLESLATLARRFPLFLNHNRHTRTAAYQRHKKLNSRQRKRPAKLKSTPNPWRCQTTTRTSSAPSCHRRRTRRWRCSGRGRACLRGPLPH